MSYDEEDARRDAYYAQLQKDFEDGLKEQAVDAVRAYLACYGDAIDTRVQGSLTQAAALLADGYYGPSVCASAIAIELMIRFMLVRPLVQGAVIGFMSDEWAEVLTARIATGRPSDDQKLVPAVLRQWGVDVSSAKTPTSGVAVWEFVVKTLFPSRHNYVHRYDHVAQEVALTAVECARTFRDEIVGSVAKHMGFTLEITGKWCEIFHPRKESHGMTMQRERVEKFVAEVPAALLGK